MNAVEIAIKMETDAIGFYIDVPERGKGRNYL